jgi:predicted AlkP superfamily pyrophosphatase or phosphodiesterase
MNLSAIFSRICLVAILLPLGHGIRAQQETPRLVIGIVVDQMRNDYISRYWNKFGEGGFKKLVTQGYRFNNMQYNYVPTYTGPGHATIYTGATPAAHGIVANDWFDRRQQRKVYCTADSGVATVGAPAGRQGQMSPRNMLAATVGDELRNFFKDRSKVIGIALKDRGAILPAGHSANAAYWFDGESGNWISSTHYMKDLPGWLHDYNIQQKPAAQLEGSWNPLLPIDTYTESLPDDNPFETPFKGTSAAVFPYDLKALAPQNGKLNLIRSIPAGNTLTAELARLVIENEQLGADSYPDMLCVSFSSTDYIGHQFGADAIETEDAYLRLDRDLAELLKFAEEKTGKNRLLVFLTADHGGATTPAYLKTRKWNAGYLNPAMIIDSSKKWLNEKFNAVNWIAEWNNDQLYLDEEKIFAAGIDPKDVEQYLCRRLEMLPGVRSALSAAVIRQQQMLSDPAAMVQRGYYAKRSGNIFIMLDPSWMEYAQTGTTHGSSYSYDTHVPMLWYGMSISHGQSDERVVVQDIAPTLSALLGIPFTNAGNGNVLKIK